MLEFGTIIVINLNYTRLLTGMVHIIGRLKWLGFNASLPSLLVNFSLTLGLGPLHHGLEIGVHLIFLLLLFLPDELALFAFLGKATACKSFGMATIVNEDRAVIEIFQAW